MRDTDEEGWPKRYRYDLLANCRSKHYIMRAHKQILEGNGQMVREVSQVAESLYAGSEEILNVFLDIAHAADPVDPIHLSDILEDCSSEGLINIDEMTSSGSLTDYHRYEVSG